MQTLGEKIRELREQKDLSLREFAKKLGGLSAAFLSDVELGRRHPSETVLAEMARILGIGKESLKQFDTRAPLDELRRQSAKDPAFGFALRQLADKKISSEELMRFLKGQPNKKKDL